jgi:hypothetical protein
MVKNNHIKTNDKDQLTLRIDATHIRALESLIPGFGSNVSEVIRHIVVDWLKENLSIDWMKEKGLIK